MKAARRLLPLFALALAGAVPGQTPPPSLHATWLRELLDLDAGGAAADYLRIAGDPQAPLLDRQLATARAYELRRLGVPTAAPLPGLDLIPAGLQQHFPRSPEPQPVLASVLEAAAGDGARLRETLLRDGLPQLRPLVGLILDQNRRPPRARDPRVEEWLRANDIVRAELDGRAAEAAALRARSFPDWRPEPWPADAAATWAGVRLNLAQWLQERELTPQRQALLRRLRAALEAAARDDPAAALRLLDRLPLYRERLRTGL
jgi:hypothetical protein